LNIEHFFPNSFYFLFYFAQSYFQHIFSVCTVYIWYMRKFLFALAGITLLSACNEESKAPSVASIEALNLKKGAVISCSPGGEAFGAVGFETSCGQKVKKDFDLGIALLHSFEYDEAEKVFAKVIEAEPGCAIAYWGVAMSNYHPLWAPPTQAEFQKGTKAIAIAQSISKKTDREAAYIDALASFYADADKKDHRARIGIFEKAMEKLYTDFPNDKEAAIFYALTLTSVADPADKTYAKQKKSSEVLSKVYADQPDHPGIIHYIIHANDYPELAHLALAEARKYASIAPSSAHAQHMPSHIFTRLGLWQECINSNAAAATSAACYAQSTGIKGHWDEELHALDYLTYGYLQQGDNDSAQKQLAYLQTINVVSPVNFKVAYAYAAMPSRYVLENKMWKEAAVLQPYKSNVDWEKYPWQNAIMHFARLLGSVHTGRLDNAKQELKTLNVFRDSLLAQKDAYKANQVAIQIKSSEAWISLKEGKKKEAIQLMLQAAEMEDKTEKHSVTPGEVLPAKELLGDLYMELNEPVKALEAYEESLVTHANRFNSLYNAGLAAEQAREVDKAFVYYRQLIAISRAKGSKRPELIAANAFLDKAKGVAGLQ
jgi:tetratricopeptide (TPR) repeat protein